jgi:hypothetical protein
MKFPDYVSRVGKGLYGLISHPNETVAIGLTLVSSLLPLDKTIELQSQLRIHSDNPPIERQFDGPTQKYNDLEEKLKNPIYVVEGDSSSCSVRSETKQPANKKEQSYDRRLIGIFGGGNGYELMPNLVLTANHNITDYPDNVRDSFRLSPQEVVVNNYWIGTRVNPEYKEPLSLQASMIAQIVANDDKNDLALLKVDRPLNREPIPPYRSYPFADNLRLNLQINEMSNVVVISSRGFSAAGPNPQIIYQFLVLDENRELNGKSVTKSTGQNIAVGGMSGSPALDEDGNLMGILSAGYSDPPHIFAGRWDPKFANETFKEKHPKGTGTIFTIHPARILHIIETYCNGDTDLDSIIFDQ